MAKNVPSAEQIAEFATYIEHFQTLLNLRDWRIEATGKPAQKGALADIAVSPEDRLAVWSLGRDWGNMPINSKTLRETALHEILHVFLRPLIDACASRDDSADSLEHSAIVVLEKLLSK